MSKLLASALCLIAATTPVVAEETLLILARHAEKQAESGNPDLTPRGLQRAEALADIAVDWNAQGVYSTDFCRTAQTAQPAARRLGVPIVVQSIGGATGGIEDCTPPISTPAFILDPQIDNVPDLLSWVLEQHAGGTVLIVGHSNTVPRMLASLGVGRFEIADDEYDRLFMVTHDSEQGSRVVESSYGEPLGPEPATASASSRLPIVDQAIEFHGGGLFVNSTTRLDIKSNSGEFSLEVTRRGPRFDYRVRDLSDGVERRARVDNDTTELWLDGERQSLDGERSRRVRDFVFARVYFPFLPYGLNDPEVFKLDQGIETWGDRRLHRVKVTFAPGTSSSAGDDYAYWFDPESGRLEQFAYSFDNGEPTGGLRFRKLSNYRRIGGLLFHDASNGGVDGEGDYTVDVIDPEWVRTVMRPVSEIVVGDIEVEALSD